MITQTPLYGLLLVGGKSSRMGEDKASIIYQHNTPEWKRLSALLGEHCDKVFLCHRADQDFGVNAIIDPGEGPLKAIQAALNTHPDVAWLTIACDLPLLNSEALEKLINHRDPSKKATCYASSIDQLPEPLCCIYEPAIAKDVNQAIQAQRFCPRSLLKSAHLLPLDSPLILLNANTPADKVEIDHMLNQTQSEKTLHLQYFAQLKDIVGCDEETVTTSFSTASGLYEELRTRYPFPYKQKQLMLAINDEFMPWETPLQEGDNVVFMPPVAGG